MVDLLADIDVVLDVFEGGVLRQAFQMRSTSSLAAFIGEAYLKRRDPHTRPNQTKKSPAPAYHAATKAARERLWEAYSAFVATFREAAEKLKAGDRTARFPLGSFPPSLPFVSAYPSRPP